MTRNAAIFPSSSYSVQYPYATQFTASNQVALAPQHQYGPPSSMAWPPAQSQPWLRDGVLHSATSATALLPPPTASPPASQYEPALGSYEEMNVCFGPQWFTSNTAPLNFAAHLGGIRHFGPGAPD
ncbi:hypothetical protein HGRIS_000923 [Hohenbuehelia grisea]|uniref:Uncharacterized protein n=1 Tax=Hohenbuehelia grisea TaxID=104357 RepID=A0ABR3IQ99_9AGAR